MNSTLPTNKECQSCHGTMKLIPSGISKRTGRPYNAFYSCQDCKAIDNLSGEKKPSLNTNKAQLVDFLTALNRKLDQIDLQLNEIYDKVDRLCQKEKENEIDEKIKNF